MILQEEEIRATLVELLGIDHTFDESGQGDVDEEDADDVLVQEDRR